MYTGNPYDSATGLYYYGARFCDSTTGRFTTQDSYAGDKGDPMTLNRYIYARDNPERYTDPNGHVFIDEDGVYYSTSHKTTTTVMQPDIPWWQQMEEEGITGTAVNGGVTGAGPSPAVTTVAGTTSTHAQIDSQGMNPNVRAPSTNVCLAGHCWAVSGTGQTLLRGTSTGPTITQGEVGAILVTTFLGTLTVASGLATIITTPLVLTGVGAIVPAAFASTTVGLATSTWDAGVYTATEGPNATPEGAFASTPLDVFAQWLGDALSHLP